MEYLHIILSCLLITGSQDLSIQFDPPLFSNIKELPFNFEAGLACEYEVVRGEKSHTHRIEVKQTRKIDEETYADIAFTSDVPQKVTMEMALHTSHPEVISSKEIKVIMPFGTFQIAKLEGNLEEIDKESGHTETLELFGKSTEATRLDFRDGNGNKGVLWIGKGFGPLGIAKLEITKAGVLTTYTLKKMERDTQ